MFGFHAIIRRRTCLVTVLYCIQRYSTHGLKLNANRGFYRGLINPRCISQLDLCYAKHRKLRFQAKPLPHMALLIMNTDAHVCFLRHLIAGRTL